MSEKDQGNVAAILEACSKIRKFVETVPDAETLFEDEMRFDAVLMNFVIIEEAVGRLSDELKFKHAGIPWAQIKGFRNIVAHDYFGVDVEEVWQIILDHLPLLEKNLKGLLG